MPTFNDKCALLITYYLDNTTTKELCIQFLVWGPPVLFGLDFTNKIIIISMSLYITQCLLLATFITTNSLTITE